MLSAHVQARLSPAASHRYHGHEPFLFAGKVRERDAGSPVLTYLDLAALRKVHTSVAVNPRLGFRRLSSLPT
jgi:hypothetical protein